MKGNNSQLLKIMLPLALLILGLQDSRPLHADATQPLTLPHNLPPALTVVWATESLPQAIPSEPATAIPDREGIISDTRNFLLFQLAFTGFLYIAPESISNWSDEQKKKDRF